MTAKKDVGKLGRDKDCPKGQLRRVFRLANMPPEVMEAISKVEMDPKWNYLNEELKDWKP